MLQDLQRIRLDSRIQNLGDGGTMLENRANKGEVFECININPNSD